MRCPNSSLTARLTPSSAVRWQTGKHLSGRTLQNCTTRRTFTNSRPRDIVLPTRTTTTAPNAEKSVKDPKNEISQSIKSLYGASSNSEQTASKISNFLKTPAATTSKDDWRNRTRDPSQSPVLPLRFRPGDDILNGSNVSADTILKQINERTATLESSNRGINTDNMLMPSSSAPDVAGLREDFRSAAKKDKVTFVLKPSLGRSIDINAKIDVGRGFRLLEQSCARNKVRSDFTKQRFHERPGLKRKRLGRERWRRKFMEGFKATIGRVKQMRRQGW